MQRTCIDPPALPGANGIMMNGEHMRDFLTADEMRALEASEIASGRVSGLDLMERAGRGLVQALFAARPDFATAPHKAMVLCGPGNNGGDGFVIARLLAEHGWQVDVYLYTADVLGRIDQAIAALPADARANAARWQAIGPVQGLKLIPHDLDRDMIPDVLIDAVFGTGLTRPLDESTRSLLRAMDREMHGRFVLAVDLPSGLCADSGRILADEDTFATATHPQELDPLRADLTVTFHQPRLGHMLADGPRMCGTLAVADIGLDLVQGRMHLSHRPGAASIDAQRRFATVQETTPSHVVDKTLSHKYDHGHALVLGGGPGQGGAARLAARGALRVGAGLVTVACPPDALAENAARLDAIMLRPLTDGAALSDVLADDRITAVCLGPGLGVGARARQLVAAACAVRQAPGYPHTDHGLGVVLDADALTSFQDDPDALFAQLHRRVVLTPHMGEFARLFPDLAERMRAAPVRGPAWSKVDAVREAASRAGAIVLLKGADTVIAEPALGRTWVNASCYTRKAPWLATAGSGDVLAGLITGLLARDFGAPYAAADAAWLHTQCALQFGPGLIAEDLPEQLPAVIRDVLARPRP